ERPAMPMAWLQYVVPALLIATRLSGLMLVAPFFGADAAPPRVRAGLVIALTALLLPITHTSLPSQSLLAWFGDGISELVIGVLLGLVMQIVFEGAQLAGGVAAFQLGLGLESSIDPTTQADSTVLATFHNLVALYLFLQMGVHRWVLLALTSSFITLPLGASLAALNGRQLLEFAGNLWVWGLELVLPILIATLLIDVTLGFFAKAAPQLPVIFVGIPVKELVGYAVLLGAVRYWPGLFSHQFSQALSYFMQHARPLA
ncbi:MAG: flagellar biosynthetic protein FliR, partial [Terriglobales bacterium]